MPFFSIIIPVYNVAPYLRECLDSVVAQTFTDWEAICVDDGSTDGSGSILDEYAAKEKRFKVIHQANAGVSAARNAALDVANGAWVGFLDADDVWANTWLDEVAVNVSVDVDWIRTGWTNWSSCGKTPCSTSCRISGTRMGQSSFSGDIVREIGWELVSRCAFPVVNFYRINIVSGIRFPDFIRFREDALFCYEVAAKARGLRLIDTCGYFRRERNGSATFQRRRRDDTIKLLSEYGRLWQRVFDVNDSGLITTRIVSASSFWVCKDVHEWFNFCDDIGLKDSYLVWRETKRLIRLGAISWKLDGTLFDRLRWRIYLATGCGRVLLINRLNLIGRCARVRG